MRHTLFIAALLVTSTLAAACAPRQATPTTPPPPTGQASQPPTVGVVMREFEFEPRPLKAKAGKVRFLLMNRGTVDHDFTIPSIEEHNQHEQHVVQPGKTLTVELELASGTYEAICTIPGHQEAGMKITIEVSS